MNPYIQERLPYHIFLKNLAMVLRPKVCVEIGTNTGMSSNLLKEGFPEMVLYTMDIMPESGFLIKDSSIIRFIGDSKTLSDKVPNEIDLLFIDGDHTYEGCKADYFLYEPKVKYGGIILIDDALESEGVNKFWKELGKGKILEGVHESHGMGIIHK